MSDYNYQLLWLTILIIGFSTFIIRSIFLFLNPKFSDNPIIKRGMRSVPSAMLVALVVPFTLFADKQIDLWRIEVYSIFLTIPLVMLTKKYGYGLIFALVLFLVLSFLLG